MRQYLSLVGAASALLFLGAGCISFGGAAKMDGGLFASADRGEKWVQRGAILTIGSPASLANTNITVIVQDPSDRAALYVGTEDRGGFYSWDGGNGWRSLGAPFATAKVQAIAVDPRAKCTIYVAAGPKVYRSTDCTRSWRSSDFEATMTSIAIDPTATATLYAGNIKGDILKSVDGGASWRAIRRLDNRIRAIKIATATGGRPPVTVFIATQSAGFYRSTDGGVTWIDLRKGMESFEAAFDYRGIVLAGDEPNTMFSASKYGILVSVDAGTTWQPLTLITAPGAVDIAALAVNPRNRNEIAYATATTFYKSSDGGKSWVSKKLPTSRAASALFVDAADGNVLWMGTVKLKK